MKTIAISIALLGILPGVALAQQSEHVVRRIPAPEVRFAKKPADRAVLAQAEEVVAPEGNETNSDAVTLEEIESLALGNNPTLAKAAARVDAARGQWLQVGLYPNPTTGYTASEIGNEGKAGQQGAFVGQEFVTANKRGLNRAIASREVEQAQQQLAAQRLRVLNDVRVGFYDVLVAQRRIEISQELLTIGEQSLNAADALLKAKEGSRVDQLQARVELNNAKILLVNARNDYIGAWRRLTALAGIPDMQQRRVAGDIVGGMNAIPFDEARDRILTTSPELMAADLGVDRAEAAVARARVEPIPNVDVQAMVQHDNATQDDIVGIQAGIPIPVFNRNQGNLRKAEAEVIAARNEVGRVELELQHRLATVFQRYATAKQQVDIYSSEILPDARASLDLVRSGYQQGEYNYLVLLTAQRTFFQTNLAYLDALRQLRESTIGIEGLLLNESLRGDGEPR